MYTWRINLVLRDGQVLTWLEKSASPAMAIAVVLFVHREIDLAQITTATAINLGPVRPAAPAEPVGGELRDARAEQEPG